jgi:precorrin-6B methylase 2
MTPQGLVASLHALAIRAAWRVGASLKNRVVSADSRYLTVRFGPAKGAVLFTNRRHGSRALYGLYERELARHVYEYVRPGACCYDIGAAGGYYTFAFARLASPGRVMSLDADATAVGRLRTLVERNSHLGSLIAVEHVCLGSGTTADDHPSLDSLIALRDWPPPDVIKLDAEGAEAAIIAGALDTLRTHRPRLIVEVHSPALEEACLVQLGRLGYASSRVECSPLMAESTFRGGFNRWICAR